jgi:hypothetical protein
MLQKDIKIIFSTFQNISCEYQISNAINRSKWGFFSTDEYLKFYQIVMDIRDRYYPDIRLIGPSVIDFEYHYTARALFNFYNLRFDKISALLYVDRRGAPENRQMIFFNLTRKIDLLFCMMRLSNKCSNELIITETNWPLKSTAPYAPTSEHECISEDEYRDYMIRYYILALSTNKIQKIYWHQLIAIGYGLVSNRDGKLKRTKAFFALKLVISLLKNSSFLSLEINKDIYIASFDNVDIMWSTKRIKKIDKKYVKILTLENIVVSDLVVSPKPILCIKECD